MDAIGGRWNEELCGCRGPLQQRSQQQTPELNQPNRPPTANRPGAARLFVCNNDSTVKVFALPSMQSVCMIRWVVNPFG
jgi:hypothetical protein